ncbi:hypothetical protein RYT91_004442 [Salmonella enterica]|nr:hypothetical protein [Salmonella enterica]ELG0460766.1 hypothetical protein [Salmonella enterica]ELM2684162.1 hypothetical protein [Salmonella enterica]
MFDLNDIANAILVAANASHITGTFAASVVAGAIETANAEIPAFDFTVTEDEQTGGFVLAHPQLTGLWPFTLDTSTSLYTPDNLMKISGAGITVAAATRLAENSVSA